MSQIIKNSLLENRAAMNLSLKKTMTMKNGMSLSYKTMSKPDIIAQRAELKKELLILEEQNLKNKNLFKKSKINESSVVKLETELKQTGDSHLIK